MKNPYFLTNVEFNHVRINLMVFITDYNFALK